MIEEILVAAVTTFSIGHPEIEAEITIEVEVAVSGHSVSRTIVAGELVGGQEMCRGP
jgi:hypothetical protein